MDALSQLLPPGCQLMPAVKANAYGHGAVLIAKALQEKGIRAFCVASVTEGVELRKNGITGKILILSWQVYQYNNSLFRRASFLLWDAGVFVCRFLGNCPGTCHCRSPPTPFRSLVHPQSKWRYIFKTELLLCNQRKKSFRSSGYFCKASIKWTVTM